MSVIPAAPPADTPVIVPPKYHVRLEKNTRGHNWEISVRSDNLKEVMDTIDAINQELTQKYGNAA